MKIREMKNQIRIILFIIIISILIKLESPGQVIEPDIQKLVRNSSLILLSEMKSAKYCSKINLIPDRSGKTGIMESQNDGYYFIFEPKKILKGNIKSKEFSIFMEKMEYGGQSEGLSIIIKDKHKYLFFLNPRSISDSIKSKYSLTDSSNYFPYFGGFGVIDMKDKGSDSTLAIVEQLCAIIPPPPSAGTSSSQLADSLGIKLDTYASSSSIRNDKFVENLKKQIKQIQTHIQKGKKDKAIQELKKFQEKLHNVYFKIGGEGQNFISPDAYGYLYYTAQYIIDLLNSGDNGGGGSGGGGGGAS